MSEDQDSIEEMLQTRSILGDPIHLLIGCFNSLYPELGVKIAYSEHLDLWTAQPPLSPEEATGLLETPPLEKDSMVPMDERDWTTGAMLSVVRCKAGIVIVLDWEAPHTDNVAVLLEILPRLISNPHKHDAVENQYKYRVARYKLSTLFEQVMEDYYNNVLPVVLDSTDRCEIIHTPYDDLFTPSDADEFDDLDEDDDDTVSGGV